MIGIFLFFSNIKLFYLKKVKSLIYRKKNEGMWCGDKVLLL